MATETRSVRPLYLVNGQYQSLGFGKLVRIDRR